MEGLRFLRQHELSGGSTSQQHLHLPGKTKIRTRSGAAALGTETNGEKERGRENRGEVNFEIQSNLLTTCGGEPPVGQNAATSERLLRTENGSRSRLTQQKPVRTIKFSESSALSEQRELDHGEVHSTLEKPASLHEKDDSHNEHDRGSCQSQRRVRPSNNLPGNGNSERVFPKSFRREPVAGA